MKAIVQDGYGSPDVLRLREMDRPSVSDDGVLIRIQAASVNAADYHLVHMPVPARVFFGLRRPRDPVRGFDLSGVVESVGKSVTRFKPGDEVFGVARGTFAEYAVSTEERLVSKPRRLSFLQAAAVPVAALSALQGLRDKAAVQPGQRVLIHGAGGGVGTFAVQIAKILGTRVTAVTSTRNLEVVRALEPDDVIDYTTEDFTRRAERYDVFFDIAATRSLSDCLSVITPRGTLSRVGAPKGGMGDIVAAFVGASLRAPLVSQRIVNVLARARQNDLLTLRDLLESGKLSPVIDREYRLHELPEAIRYTKAGQGRAKVVIAIGD